MSAQTKMKGNWQQAKGRIKEAWGELTDDEIQQAEGNWDQIVGTIREKTGESIDEIEAKLNGILDSISEPEEPTEHGR